MENKTKNKIIELLQPKLDALGLAVDDVDAEESLLSQGVLDSMSFLEFMMELEEAFDKELDFSELDPSEFTSINNLAKLIDNAS